MLDPPVVVVGAGMAGTAAAWAASSEGRSVVVVHDRAGASALYSGALDLEPWDAPLVQAAGARSHRVPGDDGIRPFLDALGIHRLGKVLVATRSGVVRPAAGADSALLDLAPLAGKRVAVADVGRDDWDAPLIAKTLAASAWAEIAGTTFVSVPVKALRAGHERRIPPYDFAELHDDEQRRASFAEALKVASDNVDAWLTGPWLGLERDTVTTLRRLLPLPLGETTSPMGGPAGARFEAARERLFRSLKVQLFAGRVRDIRALGERWVLELDDDDDDKTVLEARAVVLATGGVGAGGLSLTVQPSRRERGFELPFKAPVVLALDGDVLGGGGSLYGPSLETVGLGVLERVGILADTNGRPLGSSGEPGLFVVGDAVAGRPRTMLQAAASGIAAGTVAVRV